MKRAGDTHFLRKLKELAHRAGLNCGSAKTRLTKAGRESALRSDVRDDRYANIGICIGSAKLVLTRWQENGIPPPHNPSVGWPKNFGNHDAFLGVTDCTIAAADKKSYGDCICFPENDSNK